VRNVIIDKGLIPACVHGAAGANFHALQCAVVEKDTVDEKKAVIGVSRSTIRRACNRILDVGV